MSDYHREVSTTGQDVHQRAERMLGKSDYTHAEYLGALIQAHRDTATATTVEELARDLLKETPKLKTIEAARVLAEAKLGLRRAAADPIQVTAERLARERGTRLDWIRDYRELSELYQDAERVLAAERHM